MFNFREYNIADWFSFYRILAAPILLILLILDERFFFSWMLLISYSTDMIDGFLARKLQISSSRGAQIDSLGDQLTLVLGLTGLVVFETDFIRENYLLIMIPLGLYFLQMILAFIRYKKSTAFHTYLAKMSALLQGVFILGLLFFGPIYPLFYLTVFLGIVETLEEIALIFLYKDWTADVKGLYWALSDPRRLNKPTET